MADVEAQPPLELPNKEEAATRSSLDMSSAESTKELPPTDLPAPVLSPTTPSLPLDWSGPSDPSNPNNWPLPSKIFQTFVPALFGFIVTFATSTPTSAIASIATTFSTSSEVALLTISLYTVGCAIGPLIGGPLSEIYGRRAVYWGTLPLLVVFTAASGAAKNLETLLICRFLAGIGGSGGLAVGAGTVGDVWAVKNRGPAALFFILCPFLGPIFAPLAGAYVLNTYTSWRWTIWIILIVAAPICVATIFLRETSKKQILTRHHKTLGTYIAPRPTTSEILATLRTSLLRPLHMLVVEPLVAFLSLYMGFSFGMIFSFFGSYRIVFATVYGFNAQGVGLAFLGILAGFLCAVPAFITIDRVYYGRALKKAGGRPASEARLYPAMLGSLFMPIGLFWIAWAPRESVPWIVPVLAGVPFGCGAALLVISAITYLVDAYPPTVSVSAMAAASVFRYTLSAAFPLFTVQVYESSLGIHWAGSIFAFFSLLLMPVPWVFYRYGKYIRARSRYPTPGR